MNLVSASFYYYNHYGSIIVTGHDAKGAYEDHVFVGYTLAEVKQVLRSYEVKGYSHMKKLY